MARTTLQSINFKPGVNKDDPQYTARGMYVDTDKTRFWNGFPENIGGTSHIVETQFLGRCRWEWSWSDLMGFKYAAFGTSCGLYVLARGALIDVTPADTAASGTLVNPFDTTSGSNQVRVNAVAHGQLAGDSVYFYTTTPVAGLLIVGPYVVQAPVTANSFFITASDNANATVVGGGGNVDYQFYRAALGLNPFTTTISSDIVSVAATNHGKQAGDRVIFTGATAFNGVDITPGGANTEYFVVTVLDVNTFTIQATTTATASGSGGGAGVTRVFLLSCGSDDYVAPEDALGAYGLGPYGMGPYGGGLSGSQVRTWSGGNFGEILLASPRGGALYEFQPTQFNQDMARAGRVTQAPSEMNSVFVTPEGFVAAVGSITLAGIYDPLTVRWSDRANYYNWTQSSTSASREFRLGEGSYAVRGIPSRNQSLIWTDTALYGMQASSDPGEVYAVDIIATGCGLIGQNAAVDRNGVSFWISTSQQFYTYSGGLPRPISNPNLNWFFGLLAVGQEDKIYAAFVGNKNEAWWLFPTVTPPDTLPDVADLECSRYIAYNYVESTWHVGTYDRTAMMDRGVIEYPIGASSGTDNKYIWYMETGASDNGEARLCYATTAPFDVSNGDQLILMDRFQYDVRMEDNGVLNVDIYAKEWPNAPQVNYGPYVLNNTVTRTDMRLEGRQVQFRFSSNDDVTIWRGGTLRTAVKTTGRR